MRIIMEFNLLNIGIWRRSKEIAIYKIVAEFAWYVNESAGGRNA
jgi:hypothetical protein